MLGGQAPEGWAVVCWPRWTLLNVLLKTDWDPGGSICTSRNNGNNRFGDTYSVLCLSQCDLRDTDWLVTMGPCPDAPGMFIPLDHDALLSCLDAMQMKGFRWCDIGCCDVYDAPLRCFGESSWCECRSLRGGCDPGDGAVMPGGRSLGAL